MPRKSGPIDHRRAPSIDVLPPVTPDEDVLTAADDDDTLPPDLEFTPVPRRNRSNGLTPKRQRLFIKYLAMTGSVKGACKVIGCSNHAVYMLRQAPGAESFAAAWDRAIERGARRVFDVMVDHAVNGMPETIVKDGEVVAERRAFNVRGQMFIVSNAMPEKFGGTGVTASNGGAAVTKLKERLREEIAAEKAAEDNIQRPAIFEMFDNRVFQIRRWFMEDIAHDPAKRAAWDLLVGPADWDAVKARHPIEVGTAYRGNLNRPANVVTFAAPVDGERTGAEVALHGCSGENARAANRVAYPPDPPVEGMAPVAWY